MLQLRILNCKLKYVTGLWGINEYVNLFRLATLSVDARKTLHFDFERRWQFHTYIYIIIYFSFDKDRLILKCSRCK